MDRDLVRKKALLAASTVVLAAGLVGCPRPVGGDTADTAAVDTAAADTATDTADTALADTGGAPTCEGVDMADMDAYAACCDALAAWCEAEHPDDPDAMADCIWGPDYDGSTGCIPWGPPVPPRFRGAVA